ncbi:hypothetical protein GmHk_10G028663 [Glycine max]|nr:hypothetical protein GmHk_10G028663 [Glycine max]
MYIELDEDQWIYESIMSKEVNMNEDNGEEPSVFKNIDCFDAFNTSQVFAIHEDVLQLTRTIAYDIGFVVVITRSDNDTGKRERTSFILIGCERSGKYRAYKKDLVRTTTDSRKCGCSFKLGEKPVLGGESTSFVGHSYDGQLIEDKKIIIGDMINSMIKQKNILLTLKEHNANSCTTMKQVCNARYAYHSSIRGSNNEIQQLMKLVERDQYIHWHRLKDEDVVRDIFSEINQRLENVETILSGLLNGFKVFF